MPKPTGSALHNACYAGDGPRAEALIALGADVNYVSKANKQTPLHQACIQGLEKAAIMLVHAGARLDVRDYYNRTPLEAARDLGHPHMVAPLLAEANLAQGLDRQIVVGGARMQCGSSSSSSSLSPTLSEVLGKKKRYVAGDMQLDYARRTPVRLVERAHSDPWDRTPRSALQGRTMPHSLPRRSPLFVDNVEA